MNKDTTGESHDTERDASNAHPEELLAINEKLVIASIQQHEYAESARLEEQRAKADLGQLRADHDGLSLSLEQLRGTVAVIQAAYEREHHIAESLQRPLMMEIPEDAFPGLSVATLYAPALDEAEVGGDFFDALLLTNGRGGSRVALLVGDVTGKGLVAAALAGRVKEVLRAFLHEDSDPARTLARLNDYLCETVGEAIGGHFGSSAVLPVALSLAVLDPETGLASFTSAGAEPPALLRADGTAVEVEVGGLLLGIRPQEVYTKTVLPLSPGDAVLLLTDGITEVRRGDEFLGYEGMLQLAMQPPIGASARDTIHAILEGARAFGGGFRDDVCLLLARRQ
ncbi:MAG: serine/threonine-protein phosphatase [Cytophagales bacterium]|nr:serine/threonine-protein phosphatase [Armatimonadota bacterium]